MATQDLAKVKRNVAKMVSMNAPESDIDAYIASEGATLEQVRVFKPMAGISTSSAQRTGNTTVLATPQKPPESNGMRELKIQAQGLAAGVGSTPGFIADVASVPGRIGGGLAAMAGDVTGNQSLRKTGEQLFYYPSFAQKSADAVGGAVGRAIGAPTDLNAGEKARQKGAEFVGGLAAGGGLRKGVQLAARGLEAAAPKVAQGLNAIANSRGAKLVAPSRPADLAAAYGAGVGSEYAQQYAGNDPLIQTGAAIVGGLGGGLAAGGLSRMSGGLLQSGISRLRPNTGVGKSLIGDAEMLGKPVEINPEQKFGVLSGTVRRAAANAQTQLDSKYKIARELSANSQVTPQGVQDLRSRIEALALGTAEQNQKQLHANILSNLDRMIESRGGMLRVDDVAENIRRQYSNAGGALAFAKGEGARTVDDFLINALDNPQLVNNMGQKASRAWKDAIGFAKEKYAKYDDPSDVARIIQDELGTNKTITGAQVGAMFRPAESGSNLVNKWDAVVAAVPSGERKFINQTIKSGIMHDILKRASDATPYGFQINEGNLANELKTLIQDVAFKRKFTSTEQAAIRKLQASLTVTRINVKRIPQLIGAAVYAVTGQGFFVSRHGAEAAIGGPPTANLDEIIKMLERPVPVKRADMNFVGSVAAPLYTRQLLPAESQDNMK
jgi:hypothetical protein